MHTFWVQRCTPSLALVWPCSSLQAACAVLPKQTQYRSYDAQSAGEPLPLLKLHGQHWHCGPSAGQTAVQSRRNACFPVSLYAEHDIEMVCCLAWLRSRSETFQIGHLCSQGKLFQRYPSCPGTQAHLRIAALQLTRGSDEQSAPLTTQKRSQCEICLKSCVRIPGSSFSRDLYGSATKPKLAARPG